MFVSYEKRDHEANHNLSFEIIYRVHLHPHEPGTFVHLSNKWHVFDLRGLGLQLKVCGNGPDTAPGARGNFGSIIFGIWGATFPGASVITAFASKLPSATATTSQ